MDNIDAPRWLLGHNTTALRLAKRLAEPTGVAGVRKATLYLVRAQARHPDGTRSSRERWVAAESLEDAAQWRAELAQWLRGEREDVPRYPRIDGGDE